MRQVVLDTETTGLDIQLGHRIIEIGCVEIVDRKITKRYFHKYVNPLRDIDQGALDVHGLTTEFLSDKPIFGSILEAFLEFIGDAILVGHHVGFDIGIINYALKRLGAPKLKNKFTDTGVLYKRTVHLVNITDPNKVYTLDDLCEELNIARTDRHKAMGDAYITALAFLKVMSKLKTNKKLKLKQILLN